MARSKKRVVVTTGAIVLALAAVLVATSWDRVLEEWYLYRLASDDAAVRLEAAEGLVALDSERAIPLLVELVTGSTSEAGFIEYPGEFDRFRYARTRGLSPVQPGSRPTPSKALLTPFAYHLFRLGRARCAASETDERRRQILSIITEQQLKESNALAVVGEAWLDPISEVEQADAAEIKAAQERAFRKIRYLKRWSRNSGGWAMRLDGLSARSESAATRAR